MMHLFDAFDRLMKTKETSVSWKETRDLSKQQRRAFTDALNNLKAYAIANGSTHFAERCFSNFTLKCYRILFNLEGRSVPKNFRDDKSSKELQVLGTVETYLAEYITNCIEADVPYKEIYKMIDHVIEQAGQCLQIDLTVPKQIAKNIGV
jgi:hypothetical protein